MVSIAQELVLVDGTLHLALACRDGAILVHPRRCIVSKHMGFKQSSGDMLSNTPNSLLELLDEPSSRAHLIRHRNMLCVRVELGEKSYLHSFPALASTVLTRLAKQHFEFNNLPPLLQIKSSGLISLNPFLSYTPSLTFSNKFWIDPTPLLQLKLDVHMACLHSPKFMIESPQPKKVLDDKVVYYKGSLLGEGTYGQVFEYFGKMEDTCRALKILRKNSSDELGSFLKTILCETTGLALCSSYEVRIVNPHTIHIIMPMHGKNTLEKNFSSQRSVQHTTPNSPLFLPDQLLGIYRALASSLHQLHRRGMAHLDLKMCNIIGPRKDFSSRLIDFGLCSLQEGPQNEVLKITLDTRDPVVFEGKECFTWSDIWSTGVIFSDLVSEKRFSIIPYFQPGTWPNGKKFDWIKEETQLSLKFIQDRVNDHNELDIFFTCLGIEKSKLTVGTAYIISGCLWKNPGKRTSLGLHTSRPGLQKWPFPVFTSSPKPSASPQDFLKFPVSETQRGHFMLDGQGPFLSTSDIPELHSPPRALDSEKRKFQLQFVASLLSDLREFNLKTFLLSIDILDRVSSPAVKQTQFEPSMNLIALETVCVYFALLQSCAWEPSLKIVVERAMENLPWQYCTERHEDVRDMMPRLWDLFLSLLSTVKFQQSWDDSLWNLIVTREKHKNSTFVRGVLEGLLSWPDGTRTSSEFLDGILTTSSTFLPLLSVKKVSFPEWITPEFNLLISASPFLDAFVVQTALPCIPSLDNDPRKKFHDYLRTFSAAHQHPFWIPLPDTTGLLRHDFLLEVDAYMKDITDIIPAGVCSGKQCIVCIKSSSQECSSCQTWNLCDECAKLWGGRCSQCIYPEEQETWKKMSCFAK